VARVRALYSELQLQHSSGGGAAAPVANLKTGSKGWKTTYASRNGVFQKRLPDIVRKADAAHWGLLADRSEADV
jgi:hypothetical protein